MPPIGRIDHIALTVEDVERASAFYIRVLGARVAQDHMRNGRIGVRNIVLGEAVFNLHQRDNDFELIASRPTPGSADLCLRWLGSIDEAAAQLAAAGVRIVEGPVPRRNSDGEVTQSVYFHDPDGNLLELMARDAA
jgi:catechol 2,3-dioxygenase-like lactoylglutathione lyase family enzyme